MKLQSKLTGFTNGTVPTETLRAQLRQLSSELVTVSNGDKSARVALLDLWASNAESFYIVQFNPNALRLLEESNDPRLQQVEGIFAGISPLDEKVGLTLVKNEMKRRGVCFLPKQVIRRLVRRATAGVQRSE